MKIKIGKRTIGENSPTFIVAEAGINHNGKLRIAKKIIEKARESGADAVKFQTFKAEDLTSRKSKYYKIFKKIELDFNDYFELSDFAKSQGIIFFSTPFSTESVDLLQKIKVPAFKIASGDLTHIPLIQHIAKTKKPIILSTGMSSIYEIKQTVKEIEKCKNQKVILMHSVSSYPTPIHDVNLNAMKNMKDNFLYPIGYSDNGGDLLVPAIAVAMGAKIIEKHFTIDNTLQGPDHKFSINPKQLEKLAKDIRKIEDMMGDGIKKCQTSELLNLVEARRSITARKVIPKNNKIQKDMIAIQRPAKGIEPRFYNRIIGKKAKKTLKIGQPIKWEDIK